MNSHIFAVLSFSAAAINLFQNKHYLCPSLSISIIPPRRTHTYTHNSLMDSSSPIFVSQTKMKDNAFSRLMLSVLLSSLF